MPDDVALLATTAIENAATGAATAETASRVGIVCVVGLGYVGLPVAVEFAKQRATIGYDLSRSQIERLKQCHDTTREIAPDELRRARLLALTDDPARIREADYIIVAVPTPVNDARQPDFGPLKSASKIVGSNMKAGAVVV